MSHPIEIQMVKGIHVKRPQLFISVTPARAQLLVGQKVGTEHCIVLLFPLPTLLGVLLTTPILIAVVPAVIVSITLPLGGDAGALSEGTHCACEVAPTTSAFQVAG